MYEWFISRGRLIFRPGYGGNIPARARRGDTDRGCLFFLSLFLFLFISLSIFRSFSLISPSPPPLSTQFKRVSPRARVFVRHYGDHGRALFTIRVHPADIFYELNFVRRGRPGDGFSTIAASRVMFSAPTAHGYFFPSPAFILYISRIPSPASKYINKYIYVCMYLDTAHAYYINPFSRDYIIVLTNFLTRTYSQMSYFCACVPQIPNLG